MDPNTNRGASTNASTSVTETEQHSDRAPEPRSVLHLRSDRSKSKKKSKPKVEWKSDVVDNENMGKKKSKICCIFHPNREFGESSDDSSSGDSSSDESDGEGNIIPKSNPHNHNHDHNHSHDHDHDHEHEHNGNCPHHDTSELSQGRPNAYERQPKYENQSKLPDNPS
jgi:protein phosphatase 1 regulatory subunit 11